MNYQGKLYGCVRTSYFEMSATTFDVETLKFMVQESQRHLGFLRRSMTSHPDCSEGSEFDDLTNSCQEWEDKVTEFLKYIENKV